MISFSSFSQEINLDLLKNMKPRNILLGNVPELVNFNKTCIMGFVIVPSQPFGYNYLGGKLLALNAPDHPKWNGAIVYPMGASAKAGFG